jgi:hypothetical protein
MKLRALTFSGTALCAAGIVLSACSQVEYIEIEPARVTLRSKNDGVWLRGRAMSHTGVHYPSARVGWSVEDPSIATVDEAGRLKPVESGETRVVGRYGKITATVPLEVIFSAKLVVEPRSLELVEGGEAQELSVRVFDKNGRELKDRTPTFQSTNANVVRMGQNAAFAVAAGEAKVEVRVDELVETVDVKVKPEKLAKRK